MSKTWRYVVTAIALVFIVLILLWGTRQLALYRWQNVSAVVISRLIELANRERTGLSLPLLRKSDLLTLAAQNKADDMADRGYFSHISPSGESPWFWLDQAGYVYIAAGENLAINFDQSEILTNAWMNSPLHRSNILRPDFEEIGIGIARGSYSGGPAVFVVQYFGSPVVQ